MELYAGPRISSCEHGNELSGSVKMVVVIMYTSWTTVNILKKDWNYFP